MQLASVDFYRTAAPRYGFEEISVKLMPGQLRTHYAAVSAQLRAQYRTMIEITSQEYVARVLAGLQHWIDAADKGYLSWDILHFRKR